MSGFNIVLVFAIILFARLGIRLLLKWRSLSNNNEDKISSELERKSKRDNDTSTK